MTNSNDQQRRGDRSAETASIVVACGAVAMTRTMIRAALGEGRSEAIEILPAATELFSGLPADSTVVLDGDDAACRRMAVKCATKIIWVGRGADCDVTATSVECSRGRLRFQVDGRNFDIPVWGRHHLHSALATIAVGRVLGRSVEEIAAGMAKFRTPESHCEVFSADGATMIDDSGDATASGRRAALELLREVPAHGRRIVVCSDAEETSALPNTNCCQLGEEIVARSGADLVIACGPHASEIRAGAVYAGLPKKNATACRTPDEAIEQLRRSVRAGDTVLFQGSPARGMKSILDQLRAPQWRAAA